MPYVVVEGENVSCPSLKTKQTWIIGVLPHVKVNVSFRLLDEAVAEVAYFGAIINTVILLLNEKKS